MTSERKIAANRCNALRSTGPRTSLGKARSSRNALKHGLAAMMVENPATLADADHIATAICSNLADRVTHPAAKIIAECEIALMQVRVARVAVFDQLLRLPAGLTPDVPRPAPGHVVKRGLFAVEQLLRLDRYERRAISRRARAARAFFTD